MRLSLNEIENASIKAVRGLGLPYGLAEEAGRATAWLALAGLPWSETLLSAMESYERAEQIPLSLEVLEDGQHLAGGPSALLMAPALGDLWRVEGRKGRSLTAACDEPLLCLALLALAVRDGAPPLAAAWTGGELSLDGKTAWLDGNLPQKAVALRLSALQDGHGLARAGRDLLAATRESLDSGFEVPQEIWRAFDRYGARTLVPETAESQVAGAGAGDIDNE